MGYGSVQKMHEEDARKRPGLYTRHEPRRRGEQNYHHTAWQAMMAWQWRFFFPFSFFFFVAADIGSDVGRFMGLIRVYPYPLIPAFEGEDIRGI